MPPTTDGPETQRWEKFFRSIKFPIEGAYPRKEKADYARELIRYYQNDLALFATIADLERQGTFRPRVVLSADRQTIDQIETQIGDVLKHMNDQQALMDQDGRLRYLIDGEHERKLKNALHNAWREVDNWETQKKIKFVPGKVADDTSNVTPQKTLISYLHSTPA